MKERFSGYDVWLISNNFDAIKNIGLHTSNTYILFNGALECKFLNYSMYQGSKKKI
jgi:putative N6-adenine-specific DNA methylase